MKDQPIVMEGAYAKQYADWQVKEGGYARDMTMRDHFAGLAMQEIYQIVETGSFERVAKLSYEFADAMLKERAK